MNKIDAFFSDKNVAKNISDKDFKQTENGIEIFVQTNGVHTFIIIPAGFAEIEKLKIDFQTCRFQKTDIKYVSYSWGDKEFYLNTPQWKDLKFGTAFKAAFLPSESIVRIGLLMQKPKKNKYTKMLKISRSQCILLYNFISKNYEIDKKISQPKNCFEMFFDSKTNYTLFYTCNNWTSEALKPAGIRTPLWSPFDKGVMFQIQKINESDNKVQK